jgi:tol-pal system beta propeller repeat protein TolB
MTRAAIGGFAIVAILGVGSSPAPAAFPGANGQIAFTRLAGDRSTIWVMDIKTGRSRQLIRHPGNSADPAWSPDGRRLVFVNAPLGGGAERLYLADPRGQRRPRLLTSIRAAPESILFLTPRWAPNGKTIIFERWDVPSGRHALYLINTRSRTARKLVDGGMMPSWSPDGRRLAFVLRPTAGEADVFVADARGANRRRLTHFPGDDLAPDWSPNGNRIAFVSRRTGSAQIYTMRADGSGEQQLTTHPAGSFAPSWSPDGRRIAFSSRRAGHFDLFTMNADGRDERRVTAMVGDELSPSWQPVARRRGRRP